MKIRAREGPGGGDDEQVEAGSDLVQRVAGRARVPHPAQRAAHGRRAGPGLHRAGARRRRRARGRLLPRACATGPTTRTGRSATGSCLSIGHYAIALYAVLIEAGILPEDEIETYGTDDSRLPMSGMAAYTPGMEITGGSLGHGLGIAVGFGARAQAQEVEVLRLQPVLGRRAGRGLDLGGGAVGAALAARQPDRDRRRQQPAGRRPLDPGDRLRAAGGEVGGVRLAHPAGRRQRHRRAGRRPSTGARGSESRGRASSSATPRWPRACRSSRSAR